MSLNNGMTGWTMALDGNVGLDEELNLNNGTEGLTSRAESGRLSSGMQTSQDGLRPEEMLIMAIVHQAVEDWRMAEEILRRREDDMEAASTKQDTERFFRSRWFRMLVDLDGEDFLRRLEGEKNHSEQIIHQDWNAKRKEMRRNALRRGRSLRKKTAQKRSVTGDS